MKNLFALIALHLLLVGSISAQSIQEGLQKDSLELAYKIAILKLQKANADLQKEIDNQPKVDQKAEEAAKKAEDLADLNAKIAKVNAQKELLGNAKPTPLTGSVTIEEGKVSMAETRALVYKSLDTLMGKFVNNITIKKVAPVSSKSDTTSKETSDSSGSRDCKTIECNSTIVIYHPTYYQAFSDYDALLAELKLLVDKYNNVPGDLSKVFANSPIAAIALGSQILNALADASTLFRTETQFLVSEEKIEEDVLVSLIRKKDTCCQRSYFYPDLYLPTNTEGSALMKALSTLDDLKKEMNKKLVDEEEELNGDNKKMLLELNKQIDPLTTKKKSLETELTQTTNAARKNELNREIKSVSSKIDSLNILVSSTKKAIDENNKKLKPIKDNLEKLDAHYGTIVEYLAKPVEKESNVSMLRHFLRVEKILTEVKKTTTYTLRIIAKASATNRIRKFLWATTLKHSSGVEAHYQLFNSQASLVSSDFVFTYTKFKNSRQILEQLKK
jgi:hypothetical protein